ncbi:Acetylxylan esterase precursor [Maioricimonas rarisocia]|uniref:Acetylxylan esterase n=1 Tax=Maioricimonas rarisocia TaxID=2528026 RepID=A0A517Z350_9PLAN|nr:alpha/beta hydrolase [Maioricimonas rarisocia]QDU36930.1 Acetylxylan esterase precursor [Maioricimonas rarisocia]
MRPALLLVLLLAAPAVAQESKPQPDREIVYKTTQQGPLKLHVFLPEGHQATDKRPAIVFFFGGGWVGGSPSQFYPQCRHLAEQGMVAISAEYRVRSRHKTTPFECVADGKSAIRWVRSHADELGIDPQKLAAGGGSAGGHVAAATATVPGLDDPEDDTSVSAVPDALVLFNPVYDNGPEGYGYDRVKERWQEISPMHNIREGMPPAIVFLGTKDKLIPVETGKAFEKKMENVGSHSELMLFEGAEHGFFNPGKGDGSAYRETVAAMDRFLTELGFLKAAE